MALDVRLLGPIEIALDGLVVPIERIQVRRLVGLLARSPGTPQATTALVEQLWPDTLPKDPLATLRVVVTRLRAVLRHESGLLTSAGSSLTLDVGPEAVDACRFDTLVRLSAAADGPRDELDRIDRALAIWRGPPYSGSEGPPRFDADLVELHQRRELAMTRRAELLVDVGETGQAVAFATGFVDAAPADERRARALALALLAEGQRATALRVLAGLRRHLREGFGLSTSASIAEVEQEVLGHDERRGSRPLAPELEVRATGLRGRESELLDLSQAAAVASPTLRTIVLIGDAGIGKTSLVAGLASRSPNVLYVAYEHDTSGVASPLADALGFARSVPIAAATPRTQDARAGREMADGLERWAGRSPFLVVLDDFQWAADADRAFVFEAAGRARLARGTLILVTRPAGDGTVLASTLARLERRSDVRVVRLTGLDRHGCRRMYTARTGRTVTASAADELLALTGGSPYLIGSLADAGVELDALDDAPMPEMVGRLTAARIAGFVAEDIRALEIAAVLGPRIELDLLAPVAGASVAELADVLDRAITSGIMRPTADGLRFDHDLTRLSLSGRVGSTRRNVIHATAAGVCRSIGRDAIAVAGHLVRAGTLVTTEDLRTLLDAAELANRGGQFALGRRLLARAGDLENDPGRRLEIMARAAWSAECAGDRASADDLYDQVANAARMLRDVDLAARAALGGSAFGGVVGGNRRRLARLLDALDDPPNDRRVRLELVVAAASELRATDRPVPHAVRARIDELASGADGHDGDDEALRRWLRVADSADGPIDEQRLEELQVLDLLAVRSGEVATVLRVREMVVYALLSRGCLDDAITAVGRLRAVADSHPWPRFVWSIALYEALLDDLRSGPAVADPAARRAMLIGRELGIPDATNGYALFQLSLARRAGTLAGLEPFIRLAVEAPAAVATWHAVHAASLAHAGRHDEAGDALAAFRDRLADGSRAFMPIGFAFAASAARALGDRGMARECIDGLAPWSGALLIAGAGAACFGPADDALADALDALDDPRGAATRAGSQDQLRRIGAGAWTGSIASAPFPAQATARSSTAAT